MTAGIVERLARIERLLLRAETPALHAGPAARTMSPPLGAPGLDGTELGKTE